MYNNSSDELDNSTFSLENRPRDDLTLESSPRWALLALLVVPVWILTGNVLVLLSVLVHRHLRTLSNWVIASLAFTDFLLALIVVPFGTYQVVNGTWDLGIVPCLIWTGSDVFLSTTSILHLCAIAIHRYLGISHPLHMRHAQDCRHIFALIIPTWSISFAISLPLIIQGARNERHVLIDIEGVGLQCGIFDHVFVIYSSMVSFFLPLAIMVFADIRSVQVLRNNSKVSIHSAGISRSRSRNSNNSHVTSKDTSLYELTNSEASTVQSPIIESRICTNDMNDLDLAPDSCPPTPKFDVKHTPVTVSQSRPPLVRGRSKSMGYISMLAARGMVKINSRERRAEKTLIWVFVCFVVLWFPFFCTNLIYGVCGHCNIPGTLFGAFTWLGYISSGVNPCIYTLLNQDFRAAFVSLLTCRKAKLTRKLTT